MRITARRTDEVQILMLLAHSENSAEQRDRSQLMRTTVS